MKSPLSRAWVLLKTLHRPGGTWQHLDGPSLWKDPPCLMGKQKGHFDWAMALSSQSLKWPEGIFPIKGYGRYIYTVPTVPMFYTPPIVYRCYLYYIPKKVLRLSYLVVRERDRFGANLGSSYSRHIFPIQRGAGWSYWEVPNHLIVIDGWWMVVQSWIDGG